MNPLALFSGPYALLAKWGVILALVASAAGFCWLKGDEHGSAKLTEYVGQQAVASLKLTMARQIVVHDVQVKYVDRIKTITLAGETIGRTVYVNATDDAACVVPVGFVREHNAAWSGAPAGPASESDHGPSGVPLSEVAAADAANATAALIYKAQRDGLIEFYHRLQATENAP